MEIISVQEMRRIENECGVCLEELMQEAGTNAAIEIIRFVSERYVSTSCIRKFAVIAGKGNNGGDALVVAKYLHAHGFDVQVFSTIPLAEYSGTAASQSRDFPVDIPYTVVNGCLPNSAFRRGTVIIDGLLGIGIRGNPHGIYASIIEQINESGLPVIALDNPSGLDCDTGEGVPVIRADMTVTMAFPKQGLFIGNGVEASGLIRVAPIGIPEMLVNSSRSEYAFTAKEARRILPKRPVVCHKNTFGHLLCLAGSRQYPGAPFLAAEAALRAGAGLVTLALPYGALMRQGSAALIVARLGNEGCNFLNPSLFPEIEPLIERSNSLLYGPGTGGDVPPSFLQYLLEIDKPMVIDADGLRLLAKYENLRNSLKCRKNAVLLTPHPGEMAALQKGFGMERLTQKESAAEIARNYNAVVLLKGNKSFVVSPDGSQSINLSGGPSLATAGSGDVLAGIAGAFLAQNIEPADALRLAVFVHGHAGDCASGAPVSLVADDLPGILSRVLDDF